MGIVTLELRCDKLIREVARRCLIRLRSSPTRNT